MELTVVKSSEIYQTNKNNKCAVLNNKCIYFIILKKLTLYQMSCAIE